MDKSDDSIWIDYSLKSGLGLLSPLKDLRTLCLTPIDYTLGIPEITWMSRNWPNLKRIEGLDEENDADVVQWLNENRLDIVIENEDDGY